MRFPSAFLLAVLLVLAPGAARECQAAISVAVVWTQTTGAGTPGGSSIGAAPGDQLVAEIQVTADAGGMGGYSFSLQFDTDLGNELDIVSVTELLPGVMEGNLSPGVDSSQESTLAQGGNILGVEAITLSIAGPTSGTFVAAEVTFDVTSMVATDGDDVFVGAFHPDGGDIVFDNANAIVTPNFSPASVDHLGVQAPSLSTPALVVLSLLLLSATLWALRRRRPSARAAA